MTAALDAPLAVDQNANTVRQLRVLADMFEEHPEIGQIIAVRVDDWTSPRLQVHGHLVACHDLLDAPVVTVVDTDQDTHVHVSGVFQGTNVEAVTVYKEPADRELTRSMAHDRRLLVALAVRS